jgi:hypothetical protein
MLRMALHIGVGYVREFRGPARGERIWFGGARRRDRKLVHIGLGSPGRRPGNLQALLTLLTTVKSLILRNIPQNGIFAKKRRSCLGDAGSGQGLHSPARRSQAFEYTRVSAFRKIAQMLPPAYQTTNGGIGRRGSVGRASVI